MAFDADGFKPNGLNVAEILRVADAVERSATFNMARVVHECGTPACIAGHALTAGQRIFAKEHGDGARMAERNLGLSSLQGINLFCPSVYGVASWVVERSDDSDFITNAHAAACLRHLAATGEVDWLATRPQPVEG